MAGKSYLDELVSYYIALNWIEYLNVDSYYDAVGNAYCYLDVAYPFAGFASVVVVLGEIECA